MLQNNSKDRSLLIPQDADKYEVSLWNPSTQPNLLKLQDIFLNKLVLLVFIEIRWSSQTFHIF